MVSGHKIKVENKVPNVIYTRETPFIEFLEDLRRIDICSPARTYYEKVYSENPNYTLEEVFINYPPTQGWARSMLMVYDGQLDKKVRELYMNCVTDDVMNYSLWKKLINITDEERKKLRGKFKGKLPNIEREL